MMVAGQSENAPEMSINEKNEDIGRVILYLVKLIASVNLQPVL